MREYGSQPCDRALVAGFTWCNRRYVVRRLAERGGAVMATGAARHDTGVVEGSRAAKVGRTLVATIAWRGGNDMIGRLAECNRAVVAVGARRGRLHVVDKRQVSPYRRLVTALAEIRRLWMCLRFSLRVDAIVAGEALCRRAFEAPICMAGTAVHAGVSARERKSCREMIERRRRGRLSVARLRGQRDRDRDGQPHRTQ